MCVCYSLMISSTVFQHKILTGSMIGGIQETQEMLDFCGKHNILPFCEVGC